MPDSDLQIAISVDASGVGQGAAQTKAALAGITPQVADLGKSFDDLRQKLAASLDVNSLVHTFTSGLVKMAEGTRTFGQVLRSLGQQILDDFISKVIDPMIVNWLRKEAGQTAATITGNSLRTAANATGAAQAEGLAGAGAIKSIMADAGKAAAAVFANIAQIPLVGPFLAPPAAAAAFAAVAAFEGLASAESGFDIGDFAPLTQLHPREMVLPAALADRVRAMSASGHQSGAGHVTFNYTAHAHGRDTDDIERLLARHGQRLQRYIQNAARNNVRLGR